MLKKLTHLFVAVMSIYLPKQSLTPVSLFTVSGLENYQLPYGAGDVGICFTVIVSSNLGHAFI